MRSEPEGRFHSADALPALRGSFREALRTTLTTFDRVPIEAEYRPRTGALESRTTRPRDETAIVIAHGFSGSLDRPSVRRAAGVFAAHAAVVTFSFRGHGRSGGRCTVGDREILDLAAAVAWARELGHRRVVTAGFSMGGSVVLRHAALYGPGAGPGRSLSRGRIEAREAHRAHAAYTQSDPHAPVNGVSAAGADAVAAVSAPARWFYRGTVPMRRLHWVVSRPLGRAVGRYGLRTRIEPAAWDPVPLSPVEAVPLIAPAPLLIVHGDRDPYFPLDHPRALAAAAGAGDPVRLWLEPGMGHAENAAGDRLLGRIGAWLADPESAGDGS
ncbi:alpha/beta hydrolase [Streptomyces sp. CAU 1734]|uniref:alpha/beta hydrolase n=1 Tax=Streptomyces sp. CAU 1734 TaxID=3140360 RepID=UPI003261C3AA